VSNEEAARWLLKNNYSTTGGTWPVELTDAIVEQIEE
jgi:hypothetical protein